MGIANGLKVAGKVALTVAAGAIAAELGVAGGELVVNDIQWVTGNAPHTVYYTQKRKGVRKHTYRHDVNPYTGMTTSVDVTPRYTFFKKK